MAGMKTSRITVLSIAVFMLVLLQSGVLMAQKSGVLMTRDVNLVPDKAKILRLDRPASTIIIGNPAVADATIRSGTLMILMGKSYGITNLIALDGAGEEIAHINLNVAPAEHKALWLYKGVKHLTYNCNPRCARVLAIGDELNLFNKIEKQIKKKTTLSSGGGGSTAAEPQ